MSNIRFSKNKAGSSHLYEKQWDQWGHTDSRKSFCGQAKLNMSEELSPTTPYPPGACEDCIDILKPERRPKGPVKLAAIEAAKGI